MASTQSPAILSVDGGKTGIQCAAAGAQAEKGAQSIRTGLDSLPDIVPLTSRKTNSHKLLPTQPALSPQTQREEESSCLRVSGSHVVL